MISFIIPIYNAEQYLRRCVDSVLTQTTTEPLQVILVDDGSGDGSWSIAQQMAREDKRIIAIQQPHAGQSAARNKGLTQATGEYIAFVDADDSIAPDWCEKHLEAIEGVAYVQSGYKRMENHEWRVTSEKLPHYRYQFTSPCMRLYHREAIEGLIFPEGMIYEDVIWSVDLWLRGATCRIIPYNGYHYTINPDSTTSKKHPEARKKLIQALRAKRRGASLRGKLIIAYTICRLKIHFIRS